MKQPLLTVLLTFLLFGTACASQNSSPQAAYRMTQKGASGCLAKVVAEEANTESLAAKRKVVAVVVNRAIIGNVHVCDVVKQPRQFSWVTSHSVHWSSLASASENRKVVAKMTSDVLARNPSMLYSGITHFYAYKKVTPKWAGKMACHKDGQHMFCKET